MDTRNVVYLLNLDFSERCKPAAIYISWGPFSTNFLVFFSLNLFEKFMDSVEKNIF